MCEDVDQVPIRILVVDDHPIVRAGLVTLLAEETNFHLMGEADSARDALAFLDKEPVDVLLLDLRMPGTTGLQALPAILNRTLRPKVIILSSFDFEEEIYQSAKAGARGYLLKSANRVEIVKAIHTVARGGLYFPKEIAAKLAEREERAELTPREKQVLVMLSKGLTNKEIANLLSISQFTVRTYVSNVLEKMAATDRTEAVSRAMQQGIIS